MTLARRKKASTTTTMTAKKNNTAWHENYFCKCENLLFSSVCENMQEFSAAVFALPFYADGTAAVAVAAVHASATIRQRRSSLRKKKHSK